MNAIRVLSTLVFVAVMVPVAAAGTEPTTVLPLQYTGDAKHLVVGPLAPLEDRAVVYSNISSSTGHAHDDGADVSIMDDLHMASGGWLHSFAVGYSNNSGAPVNVTVTFYENSAADDIVPTALVGGPFVLEAMPTGVNIAHFVADAEFLPADVWMAVSFSASNVQLLIYGPPTVGTSHDLFYQDPPGGLLWFGGDPAANFCLQVQCEPASSVELEPSTWGTIKTMYR
jgi:hypothetical protein